MSWCFMQIVLAPPHSHLLRSRALSLLGRPRPRCRLRSLSSRSRPPVPLFSCLAFTAGPPPALHVPRRTGRPPAPIQRRLGHVGQRRGAGRKAGAGSGRRSASGGQPRWKPLPPHAGAFTRRARPAQTSVACCPVGCATSCVALMAMLVLLDLSPCCHHQLHRGAFLSQSLSLIVC